MEFGKSIPEIMKDEGISQLIFSGEVIFPLSSTVIHHNVHIWWTEHSCETVEHERNSPKMNIVCAVSQDKIYGPFFFEENSITEQIYLNMLQNWFFTLAVSHNFIFQQGGAMLL